MSEALRLLAQSIDKCDDLEATLSQVTRERDDWKSGFEKLTTERDDWKANAEGHRKVNSSLQRRVEELERSVKELSEEVNDMNRIRAMLGDAGIDLPKDSLAIEVGTELSSRVHVALREKESSDKREFDLMRFINNEAAGQLKNATEAVPEAIRMLKAAWHPREGQ